MITFNTIKMKFSIKIPILFVILLYGAFPLSAQDTEPVMQNKEAMEKIQSARIALISNRLGLTPEQAQKFWPIYNEYVQKRRDLQQDLMKDRQGVNMNDLTEEQSRKLMEQSMDIKQRMLDLEKDYSGRLQKIITAQQMLELRQAEQEFRQMIIERLQLRKRQQMRREQMMQRRNN